MDKKIQYAVSVTQNITLWEYEMKFEVKELSEKKETNDTPAKVITKEVTKPIKINNIQMSDNKDIEEIAKVEKRIPKWFFSNPNQNSTKILDAYMKLLIKNGSVNFNDLDKACSNINFSGDGGLRKSLQQMNNYGKQNYAKIFEKDIKTRIVLWSPVRDFVIDQYRKFNSEK